MAFSVTEIETSGIGTLSPSSACVDRLSVDEGRAAIGGGHRLLVDFVRGDPKPEVLTSQDLGLIPTRALRSPTCRSDFRPISEAVNKARRKKRAQQNYGACAPGHLAQRLS